MALAKRTHISHSEMQSYSRSAMTRANVGQCIYNIYIYILLLSTPIIHKFIECMNASLSHRR